MDGHVREKGFDMEKSTTIIDVEKIKNPPEKMRLMFEAVSGLVKEQKDVRALKVQDITAKAGIGKGTAYEYFSSKDELIAHALMYEYSKKIMELAKVVFEPKDFKERIYRIFDWIRENKEYNEMFAQLLRTSLHPEKSFEADSLAQKEETECCLKSFSAEASAYIYQMIDLFMEDGYKEGVFTETAAGKRSLALLTSVVEYAFVVMGPAENRYSQIGDEGIREFVYQSLIKTLN